MTLAKSDRDEYRNLLISGEQKAQTDFDRTVMALSGGALGISFAFVERIIESSTPQYLWALGLAWTSWVFSLACVLVSHYFSALAMRHALTQFDGGKIPEEHIGGVYDRCIPYLNAAGGVLFLIGASCAGVFVIKNLIPA
jgi:hypothetical protein